MKQNKINFQEEDFLFFEKKNSNKGEFKDFSCNWVGCATHLISVFTKYAEENGIQDGEFSVQYTGNGMVLVYCKEHVDQDNTNVYLVAVVDSTLWDLIGWGQDVKFSFEMAADYLVVDDAIVMWEREWVKNFKELHRIK